MYCTKRDGVRNELVVFIVIIIAALTEVGQAVRLPHKVPKHNNKNNKHTQTDRQTDRHTDRQTDSQTQADKDTQTLKH